MWWPQMYGFTENSIVTEIAQSVSMELPLIVGEFSQMHGACEDNIITATNSIAYKTILRECQENEIGYIAWSWFGNCNDFWDMSTDGTFNTLYDWGLEVAVTDTNSILETSVRPYYMINGQCDVNAIQFYQDNLTDNFVLYQNYPNPFKGKTTITYNLVKNSMVKLTVYNSLGEKVKILINETQFSGEHSLLFDSEAIPAGIYYYSIEVEKQIQTLKMVIMY